MTLQFVQSIREAEEKAESLIREATLQARQIRKQAETKSIQLAEQFRAETTVQIREILERSKQEAHEKAKPLVKAQQQEVARLKIKAENRVPEAVAFIKERIVKLHAGS